MRKRPRIVEELLALVVEGPRESVVAVARVAARRVLQQRDGLRRPAMGFAAHAIGVFAADFERSAKNRGLAEGVPVAAIRLLGDVGKAGALDPRGGAEEELVDEGPRQSDGVEDLRAAIGLVGRDAHLRHDLEQALVDRLDEALHDFMVADRLGQVLGHRGQRLEGEIGVDRLRAIARKAREMMDFARLSRLDDEAHGGAQALADQVMMHGRGGEQRRDRNPVRPDHAVGQHDDVVAAMDRAFRALAEAAQSLLHAGRAVLGVIGDVERLRVERILEMADAADLLQILVGEDRLAHFEPLAARGPFEVEDVRPRSDEGHEAHHELLADRVDRRVRDLREVLLEVGVEQLRLRRERRDRRVRPHRADGLLAGRRHGREQEGEILLRVAEGLLAVEQRHVDARCARRDRVQLLEHDLRAFRASPRRDGRATATA